MLTSGTFNRRIKRGLALVAMGALPVAVFLAAKADAAPVFSASASVAPTVQYLGDSAGTVFTFTVKNTGTVAIGAVEIDRPSTDWTIIACAGGPNSSWRAQTANTKCRFRSDNKKTNQWIQGGQTATFTVTATTTPGTQNRTGTWPVIVSKTNGFETPSALLAAVITPGGTLTTTAYSFQVLDVGVAASVPSPGAACPTLLHEAITGSTQNIVVCGRNRTTVTLTPTAPPSSLSGAWIGSAGTFSSGAIAPTTTSVVLGNWGGTHVTTTPGPNQTVTAVIGSSSTQTSPATSFNDFEALNQPPVANADSATTDEDHAVSIDVLANDTDPDAGDSFTLTSYDANGTNGGTISQSGNNLVFDPGSDFNDLAVGESRQSTFTYTITDSHGATGTGTVTVTVTGVNDPPTATDDTATTDEDHPVNIAARANDTDPDTSDTLTIVALDVTGTAGQVLSDGSTIDYNPNGQFNYLQVGQTANDSFTYTISDGHGGTSQATVTVTVTGVNDPPTANPDTLSTNEDTAAQIDVLSNDTDPDTTDTKTVVSVTSPALGVATITNGGADVRFDPNGEFEFLRTGDTAVVDFTYTMQDSQGATSTATVYVTVDGVNDAPSASNETATTLEDTSVNVTLEGTDPESDPLTFDVASGPSFGVLDCTSGCTSPVKYTPNADYNGSDSFTYMANDGTTDGAPANVSITITPVNDAPSFTSGGNVTALEDSGAYSGAWAFSISAGPANESGQTVGFLVTNDNNALFSVQPAVASDGTLAFTSAANANGSAVVTVRAQDNGGTDNGGVDTSAPQTFTLSVTAVNDAPSFSTNGNAAVFEDSGAFSGQWVTAASAGPPDEAGQTLTYHLSNDNNGLFSAQPAISSSGSLTFTPAANANGVATVSVHVQDNGGTANGGIDTSPTQTFTITVNPVNDAPSFTKGADDTGVESTPRTVSGWATNISAGPADESGQTLTFHVAATNTSLFTVQPSVDPTTGDLTYTPASTAGSTTVSIYLTDDGGTNNGGVDTSPTQTFTITVKPPNTAPTADNTSASGNEDGGAMTVNLSGDDVDGDAITFSVGTATNGVVGAPTAPVCTGATPNHCTSTVTYTPNANYFGPDSFTYTTNDGTVDSSAATASITVNSVNDAPSFTKGADQTVLEDAGAQTVNGWATGMSAGPANESTQTLTFHVSNNNTAMFSAQPSVDPTTGTLTYTPAANANGTALVSVYLTDDGGTANGGVDTSATQTFNINVTAVNDPPVANNDTGTTTEDTFTNVSVLTNDTDVDGDTLSINSINTTGTVGTVTNNGNGTIKYNAAGHFDSLQVGQTAQDTFTYTATDGNGGISNSATVTITITGVNDNPVPVAESQTGLVGNTLHTVGVASSAPHTTGSGTLLDGVVDPDDTSFTVTAGSSSTNAGTVSVNSDGTYTFLPAQGYTGSDTFTFTVHDAHGGTGNQTATMAVSSMVWYVDNSLVDAGDGRSTAPFNTIAPLNTLGSADPKDVSGDIIFLYQGSGDYTGGLTLEGSQRLWGQPHGLVVNSTTLVAAGGSNPALTGGVVLGSGSDVQALNLGDTAGPALSGTSVGSATVGTVNSVAINNTTGGGISLNTGTPTVTISKLTSTGGTNGINLASLGGTVTVNDSTSAISSTSGAAVNVSGAASGNLTYLGTVNAGAAGARSVAVTGHTGGTIALSGNITDNAGGVSLTSNSGTTINLTGALSLSTGTNAAFAATGGGTVTAPNANNTAATTTGTAVNITDTIGAGGVTFKSVASNGAANGIVLNNTGSGAFSVTGSGTADSGGIIQNSTGVGVSLTSASNVSLTRMKVTGGGDDGIRGTSVSGFTFANGTVTSNGNGALESGMDFSNVTGTVSITSSTLSSNYTHNFAISNNTGTTTLALTSDTMSSAANGSGALVEATGTGGGAATLTMNVTGTSTFSGNFADGLQCTGTTLTGGPNSHLACNVSGATFDGNNIAMDIDQSSNAQVTFDIENNTLKNNHGHALNLFSNQIVGTGQSFKGKVLNNTIGVAGVKDSGSAIGSGIRGVAQGRVDNAWRIEGNTIKEVPNGYGIELYGRQGDGGADFTVVNNTVSAPTGTNQSICGAGVMCPIDDYHIEANSGNVVCAKVSGNTGYDPTSLGGPYAYNLHVGSTAAPAGNITSTTFRLESTHTTPTAEISATNTGTPVLVDAAVVNAAVGSCETVP